MVPNSGSNYTEGGSGDGSIGLVLFVLSLFFAFLSFLSFCTQEENGNFFSVMALELVNVCLYFFRK